MREVLVANPFPSFVTRVLPGRACPALLGIQLDDERFLHRRIDVGALGHLQNLARQVVVVGLQPWRNRGCQVSGIADDLLDRAASLERHDVVGLDLEARDVHPPAVHLKVAVADDLARLSARGSEAEAIDDVVETRLEHPQELLARDSRALRRLVVVVAELLLENAVVATCLLLLTQLKKVLRLLDAPAPVLSRRIAAPLDRALLGQAALALEEELHALAAAKFALGSEGACH